MLVSCTMTLCMLSSSLAVAEDTDILIANATDVGTTNGPLVMILLDTGGGLTPNDQNQIADGLITLLDRLSFINAKVGLITSSNGAKVAIPIMDLNTAASVVSSTASLTYSNPSSFNWNASLNDYESQYFSTVTDLEISSLNREINGVSVNCPIRTQDNLRVHYLGHGESGATQPGYDILGKACIPDDNDGASDDNNSGAVYYRFTNIPLNRSATVTSVELELTISCLVINGNGINTVDEIGDIDFSFERMRLCNSDPRVNTGSADRLSLVRTSATLLGIDEGRFQCRPISPRTTGRALCNTLRPALTKIGIHNYDFDIAIEVTDNSEAYQNASVVPHGRNFDPSFTTVIRGSSLNSTNFNVDSDLISDTLKFQLPTNIISGIINRSTYCGSEDVGLTIRVIPRWTTGGAGYRFTGYDPSPDTYFFDTDPMTGTNVRFDTATRNNLGVGDPNTTNESSSNRNRFLTNAERIAFPIAGGSGARYPRTLALARSVMTNRAQLRVELANNGIPTGGASLGCLERSLVYYATSGDAWSYGITNPTYANRINVNTSKYRNRELYRPGDISCEAQPSAPLQDVLDNNNREYTADMFVGKRGAMVLNFTDVSLPAGTSVSRAFITLRSPIISRFANDSTRARTPDPFAVDSTQLPPYQYSFNTPATYNASSNPSSLRIFMNAPNASGDEVSSRWTVPRGLISSPDRFFYPLERDISPSYLFRFSSSGPGDRPSNREVAAICGTNHLESGGTVGSAINWNLGNWRYSYSSLPGNNPVQLGADALNSSVNPSYLPFDSPDLSSQVNAMLNTRVGTNVWLPGNDFSFVLENANSLLNSSDFDSYQCPGGTCSASIPRLISFGGGSSLAAFGAPPQPQLTIYYRCVLSATESCQSIKEFIPNYIRTQIKPFGRWLLQSQLFETISYLRGDAVYFGYRRAANLKDPLSSNERVRMHESQTSNNDAVNFDATSNELALFSPPSFQPTSCNAWNLVDASCFNPGVSFQRFSSPLVFYQSPFDSSSFTECDRRILLIIGKYSNWPELSVTRTDGTIRSNSTNRRTNTASVRRPYYFAFCNPYLSAGRGFYRNSLSGIDEARPSDAEPATLSRLESELSCLVPSHRVGSINMPFINKTFNTRISETWSLKNRGEPCINPINIFSPVGVQPSLFNLNANNVGFSTNLRIPALLVSDGARITEGGVDYSDSLGRFENNVSVEADALVLSSNARAYAHTTYCIFEMIRALTGGDAGSNTLQTSSGEDLGRFSIHTFLVGQIPVSGTTQQGFWEQSSHNVSLQRPNFLTQIGAANAVMTGIARQAGGNSELNTANFAIGDWLGDTLRNLFVSQSTFATPTVAFSSFNSFRSSQFIYFSLYEYSVDKHFWVGNVKKYSICLRASDRCTVGNILGRDNAVYVNDRGITSSPVTSLWSDVPDDSNRTTLGSVGQKLQDKFNATAVPVIRGPSNVISITRNSTRVLFSSLFAEPIFKPFSATGNLSNTYYPVLNDSSSSPDVDFTLANNTAWSEDYWERRYNLITDQIIPLLFTYDVSLDQTQANSPGPYNCWYLRSRIQYTNPIDRADDVCRSRTMDIRDENYIQFDQIAGRIARSLSWLYGWNETSGNASTPPTVAPRWPFASAVHVSPRVLSFNSSDQDNEITKIIIGTNDGQLRLINDVTGEEEWAYQISEVYDYLYKLNGLVDANDADYDYQTETRASGIDGEIATKKISCRLGTDMSDNELFCPFSDQNIDIPRSDSISVDGFNVYFGLRRGGIGLYSLNLSLARNEDFRTSCSTIDDSSNCNNSEHKNHVIPALNYRINDRVFTPPAPPPFSRSGAPPPPSPVSTRPTAARPQGCLNGTDFNIGACYPIYPREASEPNLWVVDNKIGQIWGEPTIAVARDSRANAATSMYSSHRAITLRDDFNFFDVPNNHREVVIFGGGFHNDFNVVNYRTTRGTIPPNYGNAIYFVNAYGKDQAERYRRSMSATNNSIYEGNPIIQIVTNTDTSGVGDMADMLYPIVAEVAAVKSPGSNCSNFVRDCVDRIYAVDIVGNVWRLDILDLGASGGTASPRYILKKIAELSNLTGSGSDQLFFFNRLGVIQIRNQIIAPNTQPVSFDIIYVNSGNREKPLARDLKRDAAFAIVERFALSGMSAGSASNPLSYLNHPRAITRSDLLDLRAFPNLTSADITTRVYTGRAGVSPLDGWFLNLETSAAEKSVGGGIVFRGVWTFPTFSQAGTNAADRTGSTCAVRNGSGFTYAIDALTGGSAADLNNDGVINAADRRLYIGGSYPSDPVPIYYPDGSVELKVSGGRGGVTTIDLTQPTGADGGRGGVDGGRGGADGGRGGVEQRYWTQE